MTDENLIEHIVEIDDYTSLRLKIPKVLNALELKALMVRANKLFNLADVQITDTGKTTGQRKKYNALSDEEIFDVVKRWDDAKTDDEKWAIADELKYDNIGKTKEKIIYYKKRIKTGFVKASGTIPVQHNSTSTNGTNKRRKMKRWNKSEIATLKKLIKDKTPIKDIAEKCDKNYKQVSNKISNMKMAGQL